MGRSLGIAILTVSDTRSADRDRSGDVLADRAVSAGHRVAARALVRDDLDAVRAVVGGWIADAAIDVVLTTGGTGLTGRDVTPEALAPLLTKDIPGFGETFRRLGWERIGVAAIQSRAFAGLAGETLVFALPGSPGGCRDAWEWIVEAALDSDTRPSSLAALLPRFGER